MFVFNLFIYLFFMFKETFESNHDVIVEMDKYYIYDG